MMSTTMQKMVGVTCTSPSLSLSTSLSRAHSRNSSGGGKLLQVPGISISQAENSSSDSVSYQPKINSKRDQKVSVRTATLFIFHVFQSLFALI